jgi:hypothetical protein
MQNLDGMEDLPPSAVASPMLAAMHNITARNLHEIQGTAPDDRQFLRQWRRQLQDCMTSQSTHMLQFLVATPSDISDSPVEEVQRRCTDVLNRYSRPTWSFSSSITDLRISKDMTSTHADIERELGISLESLRESQKKATRLYVNSAIALGLSESRLEEKLRRFDAIAKRVNELMFLEPTPELEPMTVAVTTYLQSVLTKISLQADYEEVVAQSKRFTALRSAVNLMQFQRQGVPTCTICMHKEVSVAATPCGHTFCDECCKSQMTACYICRLQIRDRVRLYFS